MEIATRRLRTSRRRIANTLAMPYDFKALHFDSKRRFGSIS
jgi:hypothetical protein